MLVVPAGQLRDPVALIVLMKAGDRSLHGYRVFQVTAYFFTQVSTTFWFPATVSSMVRVFPSAESVALAVR